ncbi:hypothetical protein [Niallia endozanthoxylica]|uniref:Uncharacterized protein n=1 Tax=Niallia endozanthoxylica TaxID=2036016 RepID=A0A5J5HNK4_9BACI|nr:hypothetical protein [Niallia endozanthoxylica]KAA9021014.1 hypothetical protein F4V44_17880 [Niallia endozanthoxylica]
MNSGPFHIPTANQANTLNNRIVITIKNHTDRTLQADVIVDACFPGETVVNLPSVRDLNEATIASFPRADIPGQTCRVYEVPIAPNSRPFIKVISTGDYAVIEGRPAGGLLEISVVAGEGQLLGGGPPVTGLIAADAATFVPYGSWVVEDRHRDSDC